MWMLRMAGGWGEIVIGLLGCDVVVLTASATEEISHSSCTIEISRAALQSHQYHHVLILKPPLISKETKEGRNSL